MLPNETEQDRTVLNATQRIPDDEIEFTAVRAQGAGGQNVNKVSSAAHLRFDIQTSSLPDCIKERLLKSGDHRISKDGVVIIKAQSHRSLERNKEEALARLHDMVAAASVRPKVRRPTRPTRGAQQRRLEKKGIRSDIKTLRGKIAH